MDLRTVHIALVLCSFPALLLGIWKGTIPPLVFAASCVFRAIAWVDVIERTSIHCFALISPGVDRMVATLGELALAWSVSTRLQEESPLAGQSLFIILFIAEIWSWIAVISRNYIFNVVEETLWLAAGVQASLLWSMGWIYVMYMCFVDVPMYIRLSQRKNIMAVAGIWGSCPRSDLEEWKGALLWRFCYFGAASMVVVLLFG